jgi:hypothetical protein
VIFFLYRLEDVVLYVSLFTIGHSATLPAGVLAGIHAKAFVVDAIIGLSVVRQRFDPVKHNGSVDRTRHELTVPPSPPPSP